MGSAARPGWAGQRRQPPGHEDTGLASGVMLAQPGHPGLSPPVFSHLWRIWLITGFRRKIRPAIYFTQFHAFGAVERGRLTVFPPSQPSCAAWGPGGGKGAGEGRQVLPAPGVCSCPAQTQAPAVSHLRPAWTGPGRGPCLRPPPCQESPAGQAPSPPLLPPPGPAMALDTCTSPVSPLRRTRLSRN